MKLELTKIIVDPEKRIRKDNGDITALKESISAVGLLQPLVIDENNVLLAGFRRYMICKELEMVEVNVTVVECHGDKHKLLDVELAENIGRKDFVLEELEAAQSLREEIDKEMRGTWWQRCVKWFKSCFSGDIEPETKSRES